MSTPTKWSLLRRRTLVAAMALGSILPAVPAFAEGENKSKKKVKALSAKHKKALAGIPTDPPPKNLIQDQHFLVSDEHHPERFEEPMRDLGGVYIGVGPEQNYLYAAWARPEIIILLDFDQMVVDIHELYGIFIQAAADPKQLVELWSKRNKQKGIDAIQAAVSDQKRRELLVKVYSDSQRPIYNRLHSLRVRYDSMKLKTFLSDQEHYDFIRDMYAAGRVRGVRGDLTKDKAMNGVAKAAKAMGIKVRCIYLSNVEQYFDYADGMADNVKAQPSDAASKIMRTVFSGASKFDRYHYVVQSDAHFREWIDETDVKNLREMMERSAKRIQKTKKAWILPGPA